jgi:hypothetical protein
MQGNIVGVTSRPGHTPRHLIVTITVEVEVLKSSFGDSKNIKAMGLTLGPCAVLQNEL